MSIKERLAALQLAGTGEFVPSASVNPTATRTRAESGETAPRDVTFERADVTSQATGFKPKYGRSDKKEDGSPTVRGTSLFSGRLLKPGKGLKKKKHRGVNPITGESVKMHYRHHHPEIKVMLATKVLCHGVGLSKAMRMLGLEREKIQTCHNWVMLAKRYGLAHLRQEHRVTCLCLCSNRGVLTSPRCVSVAPSRCGRSTISTS